MIIGDLNVTLSSDERWGNYRKRDPLADHIKYELVHINLVDIAPSKMMPMWDNGRIGEAYMSALLIKWACHIRPLGMHLYPTIGQFISAGGKKVSERGTHSNSIEYV